MDNFWKYLSRLDLRMCAVILALMFVSLLVIASTSAKLSSDSIDETFFTPLVQGQMRGFLIGIGVFIFFTLFDYNHLREWTWILYLIALLLLIGLFATDSIQRVHRWYRIPLIGMSLQPSELAKLIVVIALSWFLERKKETASSIGTALQAGCIVGIPFLLILKQPDLGSALVLYPIALVMFYYGNISPFVVRAMAVGGALMLFFVALMFLEIIPHEEFRPIATKVLKEYQYERLNPKTHHQRAAATAIAIGGVFGEGFREGEYTRGGWLPAPYTDSVFAAFGEDFGLVGLTVLLMLFYALIYFSFQVSAVAKDTFGRLLSAGIAVYLAMHILVNIGMMCSLLPITGVPLVLITYGRSSIIVTMAALGILQSIYVRRFMF